jgi:hypothetical protein
MNRLFILVAASIFGTTGCVVSDVCDTRTVSVGWPSFQLADGTIAHSCAAAGVATVSVYIDDSFVTNQPCDAGGVDITDVFAGGHLFTVEPLDAGGNIILRDEFRTHGDGCSTLLFDTQPAGGYVDLEYDFYAGTTPLPAGQDVCVDGSQLWLNITDTIANLDAYRYVSSGTAPACESTRRTLRLPLPVGTFQLDWMEERVGSALTASDCVPKTFAVEAVAATVTAVQLDTLGATCLH